MTILLDKLKNSCNYINKGEKNMFKAVKEQDKYDRNQTHYYLTQGDSCTIYATPYKDGQPLSLDLVEKCVFRLSDIDYKEEFSKDMYLRDGKFVLQLTHEESREFAVDTHIYEIEYTLKGDTVQTPHQWKFDILDQIIL